jgi:carboxypeptidase family protein/TonB-dependent receptor-like protein
MRNGFVRPVVLIVFLVLLAKDARAQYRTSIQGVVTDPSGAVVPGATLTLTNTQTGEKQVHTSNEQGVYNFNALPAAPFHLEVEKKGFGKKVLDNVQLIPEQANSLNVQLEVGATAQTVEVDADTVSAMDTETASINGVVSSNEIQHMPSFGRDVIKLSQLAPGAFGDGSQGGGGSDNYNLPGTQGQTGGGASGGNDGIFKTENGASIIANGQQTQNNGISIDGISTTSAVWGGATVITPTEDSVDNVKVVSNSYDAEYGRFSGAQLQITSKSGTNDFHGSLFLTTHQPGLNAYQSFNGAGLPVTRDNNKFEQFGGSVGGPVWKNKIFFFFAYESVREPVSDIQGNGWYDTPALASMAPAGSLAAKYLSFPGNAVVGTLNPNATCATAGLVEGVTCRTISGGGINVGTPLTTPLGTQDLTWTSASSPGVGSGLGTVADIANYNTINPTKFNASQYNGRLDANLTQADHIGFAIYWVPLNTEDYNGNRGYDIFHHSQINNAFSGIWEHTFSTDFLNELRFNAAGWRWNEIDSNPQAPVGFPTDYIEQTGSITLNSFGPNVGSILDQWTYTGKDVATKIHGRHSVKIGGEITRLLYLQDCPGCGVPSYRFFNIWDFLNDAAHQENGNFSPSTGVPTTIRQDQRENFGALFIEDDFKLRPNLTLNLGLRWSYFGPLYDKQGNMFTAVPGAGANYLTGLAVVKGDSWNPQMGNFGPQLGFAWSPSRFNSKLVFRGGYGLSYNQEELALSSNIVNNPGLAVSPSFVMSTPTSPNPGISYALSSGVHDLNGFPANPNAITTFGPTGLPTTGSVNVFLFPGYYPNSFPTTYTHHYSADVQYDLGHQLVASLGYEGSLSNNLLFNENPLAVPATQGYTLNPRIGGGNYWNLIGYGNYNAMLAELKHQFSHQILGDAQFTWSKCMDTSSGPYFEQPYPYNTNLDYGRCNYNVGKALKLYGVWQPVFFHGSHGWVEKIVGGWSLSGIFNLHSGFPWNPVVSVNGGSLYCGQCGYTTLFPATYLGGAGSSTSNGAFETVANSNFPKGGAAYFSTPTYTAFGGTIYGTALPQTPGVRRNSLTLPGYKDLDLTLSKAFGLPKAPVLGENAKLELRVDAYNIFNNLNLNPNDISNNIGSSNFGTITGALAARVVTLGARFSF